MPDRLAFALAQRLARVLGLSTMALPALGVAACGGKVVLDGAGGASSSSASSGGAGGTGGTGGAGGTGGTAEACIVGPKCAPVGPDPGPEQTLCFTTNPGQACPDAADAMPFFPPGCAAVTAVLAACVGGEAGQCCYNVTAECTCTGRPFLVDRTPRTAAALPGGDRGWHGDDAPATLDLPRATRAALAAVFARDALGEHASIASFARFALELMAVGAPADLVEAAHQAALDEVRHAQIAFGLATAFGGAPVGPGSFPAVAAAPLRTDLASFARAVAVEGCVHETVAALVAAARARAATDPRVAALLASIAEDEARHAELAWRTLAWVLSAGGDDVAEVVFAALAGAARDALAAGRAPPSSLDLRAFGVLDAGTTCGLVADGIAVVVEPCARALRDAMHVLVSRGVGTTELPVRTFAPPDIVVVRLGPAG
jgi:hypothetical protein